MFEMSFNLKKEGALIRKVVNESLDEGIVTEDLVKEGGKKYKTSEIGDYLANKIF
jgi:3-isopropylmalate dehydrogenase